jgi:hypothetical protein
MVVNGKNVTLRNNFKLAATLSKDKAYNLVGFVAIYNSTIQVYFLSATEYVEPCTLATPVNWDEKIAVEANSDKWYLMNLTSAIEARQDLVFNLVNNSADSVVVPLRHTMLAQPTSLHSSKALHKLSRLTLLKRK